jgi:hypothetical protein
MAHDTMFSCLQRDYQHILSLTLCTLLLHLEMKIVMISRGTAWGN